MNDRIRSALFEKLPLMVRQGLAPLTEREQQAFLDEYSRREKSKGIAFLLWVLLGCHYAYLRKWGLQFLFWITAGGLLVWWLVDLFRLSGMVEIYNKDVAVDVWLNLKTIQDG